MVKAIEGKDPVTGRFLPGNKLAPGGNPNAKRVAALRQALIEAVTPQDIDDVIRGLIKSAKGGRCEECGRGGDVIAARELMDRCLGKPVELDLMERLQRLEELLAVLEDPGVQG